MDYTTHSLLNNINTSIEQLNEDFNTFTEDYKILNNTTYTLIFSIGIVLCVDIFHHLFDAFYKRK